MMRIIAGTLKGRRYNTPDGMDTRPTMDRTKEALFGSIQFDVPGSRFLDLFAGSGGIGMEAVSRGSISLDLVEKNPKVCRIIQENLKDLGLVSVSKVWNMDAESAVKMLEERGKKYDIIFMDPPYHNGFEEKIGHLIEESSLMAEDGILVIESASDTEVTLEKLECYKQKTYKTARFSFFRKREEEVSE